MSEERVEALSRFDRLGGAPWLQVGMFLLFAVVGAGVLIFDPHGTPVTTLPVLAAGVLVGLILAFLGGRGRVHVGISAFELGLIPVLGIAALAVTGGHGPQTLGVLCFYMATVIGLRWILPWGLLREAGGSREG
ncbi:hypothetical protein ER308_03655 [Egibacter rhizosphaerae]|uniref:Uncharacterized protein n=1 Tax=Egibacter rhizosphaerae TaxID=1670831 RepID=A0A411YC04_9ACTN|nr:hypothetical protein [Egibacter rhizosphaerae]QBI18734.1 hypothetical protein ER308_03655 [Egibacter rhizosphaerae]